MSIAKRRLSPEESRGMALAAARELLIETGPQAVTLKAVASRIGPAPFWFCIWIAKGAGAIFNRHGLRIDCAGGFGFAHG